jgi:pilus assembly protein CpaB
VISGSQTENLLCEKPNGEKVSHGLSGRVTVNGTAVPNSLNRANPTTDISCVSRPFRNEARVAICAAGQSAPDFGQGLSNLLIQGDVMNVKTVVPLGAAVVLGLVAAIVARQLVGQSPQATIDGLPSNVNLMDIVVAARDIAPGSTLGEGDLTVARVEAKNAPTNVPSAPSALFHRVAKIQIPKGQIVLETLLAEAGVSGGLPGVIKPGFRAMTIDVNEFTGVAGMLQPGNRIDVLARFNDGDNGQTTRTVVQNIEIIAVGTDLTNKHAGNVETSALAPEAPQDQKKTFPMAITVLVTPSDAEKLDLASANQARLSLRASLDNDKATVAGATMASLRGEGPTAPLPFPEERVKTASHTPTDDVFTNSATPTFKPKPTSNTRTITIVRGGVVSESEVEKSDTATGPQAGGGDLFAPSDE